MASQHHPTVRCLLTVISNLHTVISNLLTVISNLHTVTNKWPILNPVTRHLHPCTSNLRATRHLLMSNPKATRRLNLLMSSPRDIKHLPTSNPRGTRRLNLHITLLNPHMSSPRRQRTNNLHISRQPTNRLRTKHHNPLIRHQLPIMKSLSRLMKLRSIRSLNHTRNMHRHTLLLPLRLINLHFYLTVIQ